MSKQTDWLENFTGLKVADGTALPGGGVADAAAAYELRRRRQQVMLAGVREQLNQFKAAFQQAMGEKIKQGKARGQRLLKEDGTQLDEIEAEELSIADLAVSDEGKKRIAEGAALVIKLSIQLEEATIVVNGQSAALFTKPELQAEFWTPLMRERILPETYIPAVYSETQRMIDETNDAYLKQVEQRKAEGRLTAKTDRGRMLIDSAADLVDVTGSLLGGFAPGTKEFKIAQEALSTAAAVIRQGGQVYDNVKARKYSDAASTALEAMGAVAAGALGIGRDGAQQKAIAKAVGAAFDAGSAAVKAGAAFAQGIDGAEEGLTLLGTVVQKALIGVAAQLVDDKQAKAALQIAAATAPAVFTQAALGFNLRQKIYDEDYAGIVQVLSKSVSNVLGAVQGVRSTMATKDLSDEEAAKVRKRFDEETKEIEGFAEMASTGVEMTVKMALAAKRGEFLAGINGLIDDIGAQLGNVLGAAGVPEDEAQMIGQFYVAASSAPKALQCLTGPKCDVPGALNQLSAGILVAFKQADPEGKGLRQASVGLAMALQAAGSGLKTKQLYDQGKYAEAVESFHVGLKLQLSGVFDLTGVPEDAGSEDSGQDEEGGEESEGGEQKTLEEQAAELVDQLNETAKAYAEGQQAAPDTKTVMTELRRAAQMAKKGGKIAASLEEARKKLEEEQKAAEKKAAEEEAAQAIAEANADLNALSEAQQAGAEASGIDKLIAKIQRDRMIYNLAMQIATGGASFIAKFVPALGAVAAGIKLAAQLHAAGLRAQQVYRWVKNQDDLEAAQSALASSAQNFVRNQAEQLAHYSAQALFAAAQLAGEITKLSGMATAVGVGLSVGAEAGAKLEEIVRRHAQAENLEAAWKITVKSLRNPTNRKLALEARKLNGSLAKYAIAWGAVVAKDPLARNAMKACDLTEASLENKDSNVDKVVQYLETYYQDDPQLYRELDAAPDWVSDDLSLELGSWTRLKRLSVSKGRLLALETGKIDGVLARIDALPEDAPWTDAEQAMAEVMKVLAEAKKKALPKAKVPMPDTTQVRQALAAVEADLALRSQLFGQAVAALKGYAPMANPEASQEEKDASLKAMNLAVRSLVKQAETAKAAAETDMERASEQLLALS